MELHKTKIDLPKGKREKLIAILNQSLADAADMKSQAKQAHWNVKGPSFIALHELGGMFKKGQKYGCAVRTQILF